MYNHILPIPYALPCSHAIASCADPRNLTSDVCKPGAHTLLHRHRISSLFSSFFAVSVAVVFFSPKQNNPNPTRKPTISALSFLLLHTILISHQTLKKKWKKGDTGHFTLRSWVVLSSSLFSYSLYLSLAFVPFS